MKTKTYRNIYGKKVVKLQFMKAATAHKLFGHKRPGYYRWSGDIKMMEPTFNLLKTVSKVLAILAVIVIFSLLAIYGLNQKSYFDEEIAYYKSLPYATGNVIYSSGEISASVEYDNGETVWYEHVTSTPSQEFLQAKHPELIKENK